MSGKGRYTFLEKAEVEPLTADIPLQIAGGYKVVNTWADVVALFDVGHVRHMVEDKDFGMVGHHGLGEGELDRDAWVVLAIDEEDGHLQVLKHMEARGA